MDEQQVGEVEVRKCGSCTLCCKILGVREIDKGRNVWCKHVSKDFQSCQVHETKVIRLPGDPPYPQACKSFECLWITRPEVFPEWLRPDKVKAFFTGTIGGDGIVLHVDPGRPNAHKDGLLLRVARHFHKSNVKVLAMIGESVYMMHRGQWCECETVQKEDGKVDAILKGMEVNLTDGDLRIPNPLNLKKTPI